MVSSATPVPEPSAEQSLLSLLSTRPYSDEHTNRVYVDRFRDQVEREVRAEVAELKQRLRKEEEAHTSTANERDYAHAMADGLAAAIAPADVLGEHSSHNNPWANALDYAAGQRLREERIAAERDRYHGAWHNARERAASAQADVEYVETTTRVAVLSDAIEAARREYLTDATGTPEDEAYQQAVADVIAAIDALRDATKGGAR